MCGVFGFQYNLESEKALSPAQRAVIAMLLADEIESRGRDASGYAYYDGQQVMYNKESERYMKSSLLVDTVSATNLIGHTRFATVGAKTTENAHPWHIGRVVGAHNGGIYNYKDIAEKYPDRKYEVDSMHLLRHIADGLDTTELMGYGTVEYFHLDDPGAIYLCAMKRGDLHIEVLPGGAGVVWASTSYACQVALGAVVVDGKSLYRTSKAVPAKEGIVYRIANGEIEETDKRIRLGEQTYTAPPNRSRGRNGYTGPWIQDPADGVWKPPSQIETTTSDTTTPTVLPFGATASAPKTPKQPTNVGTYRAAVAAYEAELTRILGNGDGTMTRRQRRRLDRLMVQTENHEMYCHCSACMEIFRLAASGT